MSEFMLVITTLLAVVGAVGIGLLLWVGFASETTADQTKAFHYLAYAFGSLAALIVIGSLAQIGVGVEFTAADVVSVLFMVIAPVLIWNAPRIFTRLEAMDRKDKSE